MYFWVFVQPHQSKKETSKERACKYACIQITYKYYTYNLYQLYCICNSCGGDGVDDHNDEDSAGSASTILAFNKPTNGVAKAQHANLLFRKGIYLA